ncbi:hypothetical protein LTR37_016691 [Vermiconidia calcicola]|uniref:Uncharacterized protein n=1 Tax=Vermiconidia calcicola TaxID=1690605 RepID=A0ACC3MM69_9PEZI|nr:hypothetical protein LTR37_016691 [Vermiconidia calcicola]
MGSISHDEDKLPTLRWGIIGAGLISSWFVKDLVLSRPEAQAKHIIAAVGSSSREKGRAFVAEHAPSIDPAIYGSYEEVYADPNVDIIYVGTPHSFHKKHALDAIKAHKHVLCEKPFTINAHEASEVLSAAKQEGVFIMEAMWLRFRPLVAELRKQIFDKKVIGDLRRTFCDFGLAMDLGSLPPDSRLKSQALGAGSLLDIGIYSLTWGLLTLDNKTGDEAEHVDIAGMQTIRDGIDITSTMVLKYPNNGRQGVLTSTLDLQSGSTFCRIEGSEGYIEVSGIAPSLPSAFTVHRTGTKGSETKSSDDKQSTEEVFKFEDPGFGFYFEADAVALDIAAGRLESEVMPHAETLRVLKILDEVRRQGGARFPQDVA